MVEDLYRMRRIREGNGKIEEREVHGRMRKLEEWLIIRSVISGGGENEVKRMKEGFKEWYKRQT